MPRRDFGIFGVDRRTQCSDKWSSGIDIFIIRKLVTDWRKSRMFQRLLQVSGRSRSGAACSVYGCMQRGWLVKIGERFRESGRFQIMDVCYPPIPHRSIESTVSSIEYKNSFDRKGCTKLTAA